MSFHVKRLISRSTRFVSIASRLEEYGEWPELHDLADKVAESIAFVERDLEPTRTTDPDYNRLTGYVFTYTGQRVEGAGGTGSPTILDFAVQTGRESRFVGATIVFWPVLLHLFVVRAIVAEILEGGPEAQLEALFHDAHEGITADVPSPFKPRALSELQAEFDRRFRHDLGIPEPTAEVEEMIAKADRIALLAEGALLSTGSRDWIEENGGVDEEAIEIVRRVAEEYPGYADVLEPTGAAVTDFVLLFESLLDYVTGEEQ